MIGFTVGNGRLAGGGFEVAPNAMIDDGLLDLLLFPEVEKSGIHDIRRPAEESGSM